MRGSTIFTRLVFIVIHLLCDHEPSLLVRPREDNQTNKLIIARADVCLPGRSVQDGQVGSLQGQ